MLPLPPTTPSLADDAARPYFLWWTDVTVGKLKELLATGDEASRAYWVGALLREANTRDIWLFVRPDEVRAMWPLLVRHLGRLRAYWAFLLGVEDIPWPPPERARG